MGRHAWIVTTLLVVVSTGCRLGPAMLKSTRTEYNQAIQLSNEEQLLLNLVRMKYRESPLFLDVGSVSAQFVMEKGADLSGRYSNEPLADASLLGGGTRLIYQERPTITYTPLQGDAYAKRLMSPLTLDTIMMLFYSGWKIDRILRLTVQQINNVENAVRAAGPTPSQAPTYADFAEITKAMADLQTAGLLNLGYEARETTVLDNIPASVLSVSDIVEADEKKYRIRKIEGKDAYTLTKAESMPVLRVTVYGEITARANQGKFARLLGVAPGMQQYDLREAFSVRGEGDDFRYNELAVGMRSLIGVLFYLSQGVEVPPSHVERGVVTVTRDAQGDIFDWKQVTGELLQVHTAPKRPEDAAIAVKHRGHWFYVADDDLDSKSTMVLLQQLFAFQAGGADVEAPVLTLPLGN